jgi:hypothetical protein
MAGSQGTYGDVDGGPTKSFMIAHRDGEKVRRLFALAFEKRPAEELYDLRKDPAQLDNVAARQEYAEARTSLRAELGRWMAETGDPRARGEDGGWDRFPYFGYPKKQPRNK